MAEAKELAAGAQADKEGPAVVHTWSHAAYKCVITHSGDEKYIVLEARNRTTGAVEYHVVSMPFSYHSIIADSYGSRLGRDWEIEIHGGGILTIDREARKLRTYGRSGGYGAPDLDLVKEVLQATMPKDWELDITTTNYIRG